MVGTMFIWLGAGRARRRKVGDAGRLLDEAARGGLPVPAGAILLDEFFRLARAEGLAVESGSRVTVADPQLLHNTLIHSVRLPRFRQPVRLCPVRAAGEASDSASARPSPAFIDFDDPAAAAGALAVAWSAFGPDGDARRDVLIAEQVAAQQTGVALMEESGESDLIRYAAQAGDMALSLPRLRRGLRPDEDLPPFGRRLQQLLRGARRTLGAGDWLVEWADDGHICWLVGVQRFLPSNAPP